MAELRLVEIAMSHVGARYLSWLNDDQVIRYLETVKKPYTLAQLSAHVSGMIASPVDSFYALYHEDAFIGTYRIGPVTGPRAWTGVMIGEPALWGQGLATLAHLEAIAAARSMGLEHLLAGAQKDNPGSVRSYLKAGYRVSNETADTVALIHTISRTPR